ncbi:MAG: PKD domain-containing protein, partial [Bacteroidetes bacterium]|nr:PKD domain-containing protein [Bacteroidota bacterium]
ITFLGNVQDRINTAQTITAKAYLYTVNATYQPQTIVDSATVVVSTAQNLYTAMFSAPHVMSTDFAVAIKNPLTTDTLVMVLNNADVTPSYGEGLAWRRFGTGVWNTAVAYATQDLEPIIAPIVTYPINTDFTMSPSATPMCLGTALTFTNTTTTAAIVENRMYNYNTMKAFWSVAASDSTYAWDMGDPSAVQWTKNAAYTYPTAGSYDITLYTLGGLWASCVDTKLTPVVVTPNAVASFTQNATASPLIAFTSTSTGAATYSWDFGDGSPVDNTANPSHTFGVGTWTVTLTVTSAGTCNTNNTTQTVTILATDIANFSTAILNVFPNPSSNGLFTIEMGGASKTNVEVYNMVGELIYSKEFTSASTSLDLSSVAAGVYSMKVNANNNNTVKQIVITK